MTETPAADSAQCSPSPVTTQPLHDRHGTAGRTRRIGTIVERLLVLVVVVAVFAFHARWVFGHFSNDGYLCDSGWFAFLFEKADPFLRNPKAVVGSACAGVNAPTFLAHHLSPHIFLFGAPFAAFNTAGIDILAYHQGLFFGLFFVAMYLVVATAPIRTRDRFVAILIAVLVGVLGNALLQGAAFPHYEIALLSLSSLAVAACLGGHWRLFACCLVWLPLVREDGGLYAAVACVSCLAVEYGERRHSGARPWTLACAAGFGIVASVAAFVVKARYFPGFDAFDQNFAGSQWDHLSRAFVLQRVHATLLNWNIAPVLAGSLVLAVLDRRYLTGIVLLAPWFIVHMLSVRPEHGLFTLYYALPSLLPVLIWLAVFVRRMGASRVSMVETAFLLVLSFVLSAPAQAVIGTPQSRWYVVRQAVTRPVANIAAMKEFVRWVRASLAPRAGQPDQRNCASMGIAALLPDDLAPDEVIDPDSDLSVCRTVVLMREDMHYNALRRKAEAVRFRRVATRETAEVWMIDRI